MIPPAQRDAISTLATGALDGFSRSRKYLAGISGGADSMALLAALSEAGFRRVIVCHLSHGIRPESADAEARMVERCARSRGYTFEHGICDSRRHADTSGMSLEAAARDLRLKFFEACGKSHRCRRIFLAHHADDQVETVLHNLVRGTGLAGLAGISPVSLVGTLTLLRPFLGLRRSDLRAWVQSRKVPFVDDPTNSRTDSTRNRIRNILAPAMEKTFGTGWQRGILRAAGIARTENAWAAENTPRLGKKIPVPQLTSLSPAIQRRAVLEWLRDSGIPEPGFAETERVLGLLAKDGPAKINLPGNCHARRRAGFLFLERPQAG